MTITIDLDGPLDALRDASQQIGTEIRRRETLEEAAGAFDVLAQDAIAALGRQDGDPWEQPANALFAYAAGDVVTHDERSWVSLIDANVWAPGVAGWRVQGAGDLPAPWVQPAGAFDAYAKGDRVEAGGKLYTSLLDANVWPPTTTIAWKAEATTVQGPAEFVQPTGAHDSYWKGELVTFKGAVYESVIDGNAYSPEAYPAGWKKIG